MTEASTPIQSRDELITYFRNNHCPVEIGAHGTVIQVGKFPTHNLYVLEYTGESAWWGPSRDKFEAVCKDYPGLKYIVLLDCGNGAFIIPERSLGRVLQENGNQEKVTGKFLRDRDYIKYCTTSRELYTFLQL